MSSIRKLYRIILLAIMLVTGVLLSIVFLRNTIPTHGVVSRIVTRWLGAVARSLGVKIKYYGQPLPANTLFVANHMSWLDILVIGHLVPVHFLSKHEVKTMPLFGWLATRAGTLYIRRGHHGSASDAASEITSALQQKHNCLVFAEGTTSDGHIRRFHSRMLQSAIDAESMVQPVAIFYPVKDPQTGKVTVNPDALFTGDTSIGESFDSITRAPGIDVEVHFLEPVSSLGKTRSELARYCHDRVVAAIREIRG